MPCVFAEVPVNLCNRPGPDGNAALETAGVDPLLYGDVGLGFNLQIALAAILAVVVLRGPR